MKNRNTTILAVLAHGHPDRFVEAVGTLLCLPYPLRGSLPTVGLAAALVARLRLVRFALNNRYLKEHGVPELRAIWIRLHYGDQPKPKGTGKLIS